MGQPKALLPFRQGTFLSVLAATLGQSCDPVCAVFGNDAKHLMSYTPAAVIPVENPDYPHGMLTSLQAGLRAIPALPQRILFTLVDHPAVLPGTVKTLLTSEAAIVIPKFMGKRGHPVVISREIAQEIIAAPKDCRIDTILDGDAHEINYVDIDDPAICADVDDPQSYRELLAREDPAV